MVAENDASAGEVNKCWQTGDVQAKRRANSPLHHIAAVVPRAWKRRTIMEQAKVSIFLSHKHTDETVARGLKVGFESLSASIDVFLSEDIPKGDDWFNVILDNLTKANLLIFPYTDASIT